MLGVAALGACGSATPRPAQPADAEGSSPPAPLSLLDPHANLAVRIDVQAVRATRLYDPLVDYAGADEAHAALVRRLLDRTDALIYSDLAGKVSEPNQPVLVTRGTYPPGLLREAMASDSGQAPELRRRGGHEIFWNGDAEATSIDDRVWIVTTERQMDTVLRRASGAARGGANAALRGFMDRVGFDRHMVAAAGELDEARRRELLDGLGVFASGSLPELLHLDELRWVGLGLDLEDGLELELTLEMSGAQLAPGAADGMRQLLDRITASGFPAAFGLGPVVSGIRITVDGADVRVRLALDEAQLESLSGHLRALHEPAPSPTEPSTEPSTTTGGEPPAAPGG